MPARESQALVLRTYPFQEADLVVSFLARDQGRLRGVARGARRLRSRFGAGLERLAHVRMFYFQRENRDLVSLDSCELIDSHFDCSAEYSLGVTLDFLTEVSEQILPEHEPNERFFRLLLLVLEQLRQLGRREGPETGAGLWPALTYFHLWAVKLGGWLPELGRCTSCRAPLDAEARAYYLRNLDGLACQRCRPGNAWTLAPESRAIAEEMLHNSLRRLTPRLWERSTAADLRQFLLQRLEEPLERKLVTAPLIAEL